MTFAGAGAESKSGRHASTCRFAVPTIYTDAPAWFDAEATPWTCTREPQPQALENTEWCETCPHWQPRELSALPAD